MGIFNPNRILGLRVRPKNNPKFHSNPTNPTLIKLCQVWLDPPNYNELLVFLLTPKERGPINQRGAGIEKRLPRASIIHNRLKQRYQRQKDRYQRTRYKKGTEMTSEEVSACRAFYVHYFWLQRRLKKMAFLSHYYYWRNEGQLWAYVWVGLGSE